jgi:ATP-dependent exoDNAse (exonuclease V) alpha subunit
MVRWVTELAEVGVRPSSIEASVQAQHHRRIAKPMTDLDLQLIAMQLLGEDGPLAAKKIFTRRDVIVAAAPRLFGLDPSVLDRVVDLVVDNRAAIELEPTPATREQAWSPQCVVATEQAIQERAMSRHLSFRAVALPLDLIDEAIHATEQTLGHPLTPSQRRTVSGICSTGRSLDVVVGMAGTGKTTTVDAIREANERHGLRVLGTATSGQAARTVGRDAGIESFTVASLLARLDRGTLTLDRRTLVILDEAGMTDDADLLRLLDRTTAVGAKLVIVGDHRQLSAVGPGGSLNALVTRFGGRVWELTDNVRQVDLTEREALAELRHGDVGAALEWLGRRGRVLTGADRAEVIRATVDGWIRDVENGQDTVMLAWKRVNVDALNELGRQAYLERGWLTGPEMIAPGGRAYRAGDRVVALAPSSDMVTSETGTVESVDTRHGTITVSLDDGHTTVLPRSLTASNRLAHAYAITVHRSQGATVDTARYVEDGGGRELAYVALSRARLLTEIYLEADDVGQAIEDLSSAWRVERRQEWVIDQATPVQTVASPEQDLGIDLW